MSGLETHDINLMKRKHEYLQVSAKKLCLVIIHSELGFSICFCCHLISRSKNFVIISVDMEPCRHTKFV